MSSVPERPVEGGIAEAYQILRALGREWRRAHPDAVVPPLPNEAELVERLAAARRRQREQAEPEQQPAAPLTPAQTARARARHARRIAAEQAEGES